MDPVIREMCQMDNFTKGITENYNPFENFPGKKN